MALLSLAPLFFVDAAGNHVYDARLFVWLAGTTTPAVAYTDSGFVTPHPSPIPALGNGYFPKVFLKPGSYDLRAEDRRGAELDTTSGLVIEAPASSGGGGGTVDPTKVFVTGDEKDRYDTGIHAGWVRVNGRNIGSSVSGASERAADDTHDLFVHLWNKDPNLAVSGGRGADAETDWQNGKTIALPDMRGRAAIYLDDMGNAAAGRLTNGTFMFGTATTLGSYGGEAGHVLTVLELPNHSIPVTATMDAQGQHNHDVTVILPDHTHDLPYQRLANGYGTGGGAGAINTIGDANGPNMTSPTRAGGGITATFTTSTVMPHTHAITVSVGSVGSGNSHNTLPPFSLRSRYMKL